MYFSDYMINIIFLLQGVMVRLMLVLAPVMCILSGIAVSAMLVTYMKQVDSTKNVDKKSKKFESNFVMKSEVRKIKFCYSKHFYIHFSFIYLVKIKI